LQAAENKNFYCYFAQIIFNIVVQFAQKYFTKFSTLSTSFQHLIWGKLSSFCAKVFHFVKCFCANCTKISGYCRTFTIFNKVFNFSTFFQFLSGALLKSFQLFNKVFNFFRGVFNFSTESG
jgi:hypothetical protein